jgi:hypothetical protein
LLAGIAAANYSHVKYFPSRAVYDAFYEIMLRVVNIASKEFAACVQELVVRYLHTVSEEAANWFEEWWTGARGRYCLCHAMHCGTNNIMGVEVDWRDIKKLYPPSATLGALLTALFDPTIQVPKEFVASEPALRKKCQRLKGTAGPKRKRLLAEMQKDKVKKASKIQFMHMEASSGAAAGVQQKPPSESVAEPSAPALPKRYRKW